MREILCGTAPEWLIEAFSRQGVKLSSVGECSALPKPVSGHIDLMALQLGSVHFVAPETEALFSRYWKSSTVTISEHLKSNYPNDVKLSAAVVGSYLLCRASSISNAVKEYALQQNLGLLPVNQGYVRCSVCCCSENTVMTDDPSIAGALRDHTQVEVLEISKGDIQLPGYNYGFIGGASGKIGDTLYFFGALESLKDSDKIQMFLHKNQIKYVSLSNSHPLMDIGGVMVP